VTPRHEAADFCSLSVFETGNRACAWLAVDDLGTEPSFEKFVAIARATPDPLHDLDQIASLEIQVD